MKPIAAEWMGVGAAILTDNVTFRLPEWSLNDAPGGYTALHRFAVTERELFRSLPPIAGAAQALRRLSEQDVRIRIITHRLYIEHFHQPAIDQTIEWLDRHDIPYWNLCFENHDTIIFTNSTNLHLEGLRADNWNDVERIVLESSRSGKDSPAEHVLAGR